MTTVAISIPDDLAPHEGEEIQFQALVQADGSFLVTRLLHREPQSMTKAPKQSLSDWARQWAGAMTLNPGETFEDLKRAAYQKKFGT